MTSISENLQAVRARIEAAACKSGRDPASVKLIAVSKGRPIEDIIEAVKAGQSAFGENYAQELRDKAKKLSEILRATSHEQRVTEVEWHFIGRLQKNKIKYVVPVASWIHSIDSVELLEDVNDWLIRHPLPPPPPSMGRVGVGGANCLIEVNIAGETSKSGVLPDNVFPLVEVFSTYALKHLNTYALALKGLMCMPPFTDDPDASRPYFRRLADLLKEINQRAIYPTPLTELSMGMTQDFEAAIEEGATMVRVGTAIFGPRDLMEILRPSPLAADSG